jgi:hypothetical protein
MGRKEVFQDDRTADAKCPWQKEPFKVLKWNFMEREERAGKASSYNDLIKTTGQDALLV